MRGACVTAAAPGISGGGGDVLVGFKIDVDTYRGLNEGVPRLLEILTRAGIPASFYVTMGPDRSGRAILHPLLRAPALLQVRARFFTVDS